LKKGIGKESNTNEKTTNGHKWASGTRKKEQTTIQGALREAGGGELNPTQTLKRDRVTGKSCPRKWQDRALGKVPWQKKRRKNI